MNELQIFQNTEFGSIRAVERNGEPWFVGRDVAQALGYKNTKDALLSHVESEDKQILQRSEIATIENHIPKTALPVEFVNGNIPSRGLTIINESGLYSLVLSSKLPGAKKFKRWVTSEVLPAIRKNGGYISGQESMSDSEIMAKALLVAQRTIESKQAVIEEMTPKAVFADAVSASKTSILVGELAKILRQNGVDMGEKRLFQWLRDNGYLIRRNGTDHNMPTQRSVEMGLFTIKETTVCHSDGHTTISKTPKITGKGQVYFLDRFIRAQGRKEQEA